MKLVVDNSNVEQFPLANLNDIAACARAFADAIDAGQITGLETAIVITVEDGRVDFAAWGEAPSISEGIGLIELAKAKVIAGAWRESE